MEAKSDTPSPLNTSSADDQFLTASSNISSALTPMDRSQADTDLTKSQLIDWADAESAPGGSSYHSNSNHSSPAKTPAEANANLLDFDEQTRQLPQPLSDATNVPSTLPVWSPFDQPASTPSTAVPFDWTAAGEHNPFDALDRKAPDFDPFDLTPSLDQFGSARTEQAPIAIFETTPAELASPTSGPTPQAASTQPTPSGTVEYTSEPAAKLSLMEEPSSPNSTTIVDPTPEVSRSLDPAPKQSSTSDPTRTVSEAASTGSPTPKHDDTALNSHSIEPASGGQPDASASTVQSVSKIADSPSNVAQAGAADSPESHDSHVHAGATALDNSHTHQTQNQNGTTENDHVGASSTKKSFFYSICCTLL